MLFINLSETTAFAFSGIVGGARQGFTCWFSDVPIFEMNFHAIIRNEPQLVEHFYRQLLLYTEAGIQHKLKNDFQGFSYVMFTQNTIYRNLEEFTAGNSKFDQLTVDNFWTIFVFYLSFCFGVMLICLTQTFSFKLLKQTRIIVSIAIRGLSDLDIKKYFLIKRYN